VRAVLQRVTRAAVRVGEETVGQIGVGLVVLVGIAPADAEPQVLALARKITELRVLRGDRSVHELAGAGEPVAILLISQFTLLADVRKGRRPSWNGAASGAVAEPVVAALAAELRRRGVRVEEGVFGAEMAVELVNDGPVTIIVDV
jgi:D-tyrosyl-tRNA(Tyr) deacylase